MYYILYTLIVSQPIAMTTLPPPPPMPLDLELCRIIDTSEVPTQQQLNTLVNSLLDLLIYGLNRVRGMHNMCHYTEYRSVMSMKELVTLFNKVMPSLTLLYYKTPVSDECISEIVNALWALSCTIDVLIQLAPSSSYKPLQALCMLSDAFHSVPSVPSKKEEDSDGEESEAGLLRRRPAQPYDYLGDVRSALTTLQNQGQCS